MQPFPFPFQLPDQSDIICCWNHALFTVLKNNLNNYGNYFRDMFKIILDFSSVPQSLLGNPYHSYKIKSNKH